MKKIAIILVIFALQFSFYFLVKADSVDIQKIINEYNKIVTIDPQNGAEILDKTPRVITVSNYSAQTNYHINTDNGRWIQDKDNSLTSDFLLCRKWYKNTEATENYKKETLVESQLVGEISEKKVTKTTEPSTMSKKCLSTPKVTVSFFNVPETVVRGENASISWNDQVFQALSLPKNQKYDINLVSYDSTCTDAACSSKPRMTIVKNVSFNSYNWRIGELKNKKDSITVGNKYLIEVCRKGTNICDVNDTPFTIIDRPIIANNTTTLSFETGIPETIRIMAYSFSGSILSYSVDWGDGSKVENQSNGIFSHTYTKEGDYKVKAKVTDNAGISASYSPDAMVEDISRDNSIVITSPGVEGISDKGDLTKIVWEDHIFPGPDNNFYDISLTDQVSTGGGVYIPYFAIAKDVPGFSYDWKSIIIDPSNFVGELKGSPLPDSDLYRIQICRAGTDTCGYNQYPFCVFNTSIKRELKFGESGADVKIIQKFLNTGIFPHIKTNGYFDSKTREAVKQYQEMNNLKITGIIDVDTLSFLKPEMCSSYIQI